MDFPDPFGRSLWSVNYKSSPAPTWDVRSSWKMARCCSPGGARTAGHISLSIAVRIARALDAAHEQHTRLDGAVLKQHADPDGTQPEPILVTVAGTIPPSNPVAEAPTVALGGGTASDMPTIDLDNRDAPTIDGPAPAAVPADGPRQVRYFGDYELVQEIARGGMGVVYRARQVSLNRPVALKMILAGQLASETDVRRFHVEAEASANLDHPGIVPIYEVGQHEGQHFFSMGFVEGQSLSQRLADGPLPAREAAELIRRVSEAIEYAHQHGVIHRDLKPANILLDRNGNPRVTDFGLAKKVQGDSGLTGSGQIMGTPSYMPPEQAGGPRGEVGPAADVYALGATLYALVTGRPPFQAATAMDTVIQVVSDEPVPPRRLNASIPRDLETICLKCLEKEPSRRYASASALAADLGRFLAGEPILARPVARSERAVKWARRKPTIAALLGLVTLVTALGFGGVLWQWRAALLARRDAERESGRAKTQTELAEQRLQDTLKAQAKEREQTKLAESRLQESREARVKEREQTELARQRLQDAVKAQAKEKAQTELAEQRLYDVRMNLVQHYWEDYNGQFMQQGLDEQLPANHGGIDRRGFEWFYWQRKIASGHITLKGHTSPVRSVAFSPDGKRIASARSDGIGIVDVWDAATGQETLTLKGHTSYVESLAFSPDGNRIASASADKTVKVWDVGTGREILTLKGYASDARSVAFSLDGQRIASTRSHVIGVVDVWDAATGLQTLTFKAFSASSVAFSPDGKRIATAGAFGPKVWDAATGLQTLTFKANAVSTVAFSPDGQRIASADLFGTVQVWDAKTGAESLTRMWHTGGVLIVAFSPDGQRIASAGLDGTVKVWDAKTGRETLTLKGHANQSSGPGEFHPQALSDPDGRLSPPPVADRLSDRLGGLVADRRDRGGNPHPQGALLNRRSRAWRSALTASGLPPPATTKPCR